MSYKLNIRDNTEWINLLKDQYIEVDNPEWASTTLSELIDEVSGSLDGKKSRNVIRIDYSGYSTKAFDVILADVSSIPIVLTVPTSATDGAEILIADISGNSSTNSITISGSGVTVNNTPFYEISNDNGYAKLIFDNVNDNWYVLSSVDESVWMQKLSGTTDNGVVIFDGTDGDIKDSGVTISPSGNVSATGYEVDGVATIRTDTQTLSTDTQTSVMNIPYASYGSSKTVVQIYDTVTGERQISELLIINDGANSYLTEYGVVYTGNNPLSSFDTDISGSEFRLLITNESSNLTEIKVLSNLIGF